MIIYVCFKLTLQKDIVSEINNNNLQEKVQILTKKENSNRKDHEYKKQND